MDEAGAGAGEGGVPPRGTGATPAPEAGGRVGPTPANRTKDDLIVNICGALKSCINDHGPITKQSAFSAAKRIVGNLDNLPADMSRVLAYEAGIGEGRHQAAEFVLECAAEWDKTYADKAAEAARYIASKLKEKAGE